LNGKTVLLVDDDTATLETVGEVLKIFGLQVKTASSARQAIAAIRVQAPDLLVSDIAMPEEDGYTLIRQVRSEAGAGTIKTFPAVALTALADSDTYQQALNSGYAACAPKPIEPVDLLGILAAALSSRAA
jgi:CheY-like chemotaxis protein